MQATTHQTPRGSVTLRLAETSDIDTLVELNKSCFPAMAEENVVWTRGHLKTHQQLFPAGQIVAELDGRLVGAVCSLIVHLGDDPYRPHTYAGITDGGFFHNHDPQGDTLYGADVFVDPEIRGAGIGHLLYEARRRLCRSLNLRRILAGGRIHGYAEVADKMSPEEYVHGVETGEIKDLVLSFQLREGFVVRGILKHYITDPNSKNNATLIEWLNPDYVPSEDKDERKVRVAAVQYQVRKINSFQEFADQVEYFVETAHDYRADFVLFPEFFSVQLLSQDTLKNLPSAEGIARLADLEDKFIALMSRLAREYGLHIVAGSHPMRRENTIYNACPVFFPDGSHTSQPKLHITPSEVKYWGITGGSELRVIDTPKARIGVLICYDSEFPEAARHLTDQGAEIIFVPYCTDDRPGYQRVRICSQARAIENQIYVVTAGVVGNLPSVPAMDIHYGRAGIFTPSDAEFARDGILAEADPNVEMMLVSDLDINDLYRSRNCGSVRQLRDRRPDLFQFSTRLKNELPNLADEDFRPVNIFDPDKE
ncbi:bifunctional GNAT family N-acetyltransferase/carbon-nitrogen hydrolase family protein [Roseibacillus ishigakijimensis]|uniref:GNAT family N-acetyltransferase n=1 Tax=Roseibacillus ishigakijimensis TaxID=454146 RepID=A0A934RT54_9BACT|nr:bifunctional GNAT family N-acetyltransferase/carbon-nitrogen hydrolase family protein [Roseibacillus ishigakijimensis]MBK1834036.1 GNAT family N-acetyltransferase [Roseibacillus ishigakijimensis]